MIFHLDSQLRRGSGERFARDRPDYSHDPVVAVLGAEVPNGRPTYPVPQTFDRSIERHLDDTAVYAVPTDEREDKALRASSPRTTLSLLPSAATPIEVLAFDRSGRDRVAAARAEVIFWPGCAWNSVLPVGSGLPADAICQHQRGRRRCPVRTRGKRSRSCDGARNRRLFRYFTIAIIYSCSPSVSCRRHQSDCRSGGRAQGRLHPRLEAGERARRGRRRQAAVQTIARYGRVDLLCLAELGYMELDRRSAELLFQVLSEQEERSAIAANEPFSGWIKTFTDPRLCAAIVDRLTVAGQIIETGTVSYRLAHARRTRSR